MPFNWALHAELPNNPNIRKIDNCTGRLIKILSIISKLKLNAVKYRFFFIFITLKNYLNSMI